MSLPHVTNCVQEGGWMYLPVIWIREKILEYLPNIFIASRSGQLRVQFSARFMLSWFIYRNVQEFCPGWYLRIFVYLANAVSAVD